MFSSASSSKFVLLSLVDCRLSDVNIKEERNKISFDKVDDELFAFSQEVSIIDIRCE